MKTKQFILSALIVLGLGLSSCMPGKKLESYKNRVVIPYYAQNELVN